MTTMLMTMTGMMMTLPSLWSNERRVQLIRTVRQEPSNKPPSAVSSLPLLIFYACTSFSKRTILKDLDGHKQKMRNCGEGELVIKWQMCPCVPQIGNKTKYFLPQIKALRLQQLVKLTPHDTIDGLSWRKFDQNWSKDAQHIWWKTQRAGK